MVHAEFLRLYAQQQADLAAFIGALVRDRHARDDVAQEVALALWTSFGEYDPARPFGAWARGVAANKIRRRWEQDARTPAPFSPEVLAKVLEAFDRREAASQSAREAALEGCVERLPEDSRRLLNLRYEQQLELEQIAGVIGSTMGAVHKALARIRARLRECVEAKLAAR
jgi:RNA polymerase sigma-70 factor (ECF subfamily)